MDDEDIGFTQQRSLLDENADGEREQQLGFWKSLFRRRRKDSNDDDPKENSALLGACAEQGYDDETDEDDDPRRSPTTKSIKILGRINGDDSDDDVNIAEEDDYDSPAPRDVYSRSNSFLVVSSQNREEGEREGFGLLHASAPTLRYSGSQQVRIPESSRSSVSSSDGSSADKESGEGDSGSDSGSGSDSDEDEDEGEPSVIPARIETDRRPIQSRSYSVGSSYSDDWNSKDFAVHTRKSINGRIQGFGNSVTPPPRSTIVSPMTFRERLRSYRDNRMQKMEIGEDSVGQIGWKSSLENVVIDLVDSVLPLDTEPTPQHHSGDQASASNATRLVVRPKKTELTTPTARAPFRTGKRGEFGNDDLYIVYLECEVNNKDLELSSWRVRVRELEKEVRRLRELLGEGTDDSTVHSSDVAGTEEQSEIEWETGVPKEGILISLRDDPPSSTLKLIEGQMPVSDATNTGSDDDGVENGRLIDTSSTATEIDGNVHGALTPVTTMATVPGRSRAKSIDEFGMVPQKQPLYVKSTELNSETTQASNDDEGDNIAGCEMGVQEGALLDLTSDEKVTSLQGVTCASNGVSSDGFNGAQTEGDESDSTSASEQCEDSVSLDKEGILIKLVENDLVETNAPGGAVVIERKAVVSDDGASDESEDDESSNGDSADGDSADDDNESSESELEPDEPTREGILIELTDESTVDLPVNMVSTPAESKPTLSDNDVASDRGDSGDMDSEPTHGQKEIAQLRPETEGVLLELVGKSGEMSSSVESAACNPEPTHCYLVSDEDE
jgi:hypothetical protein